MARPQMAMAHAVSFIAEGVFEKFPRLKVLFDECDQFWAVGLMWHMDADWKSLRDQTPWVKRLPSEYFREHIRVGTPADARAGERRAVLHDARRDARRGDAGLLAPTGRTGTGTTRRRTFPKLPERLHRRVFAENARELFGL